MYLLYYIVYQKGRLFRAANAKNMAANLSRFVHVSVWGMDLWRLHIRPSVSTTTKDVHGQ